MKRIFPHLDKNLSKNIQENLIEDFKHTDKVMLIISVISFIIVISISAYANDTYKLGFIGGGVTLLVTLFAYFMFKGTYISRILFGLSLMQYPSIMVQQQLGMVEMHFGFFIMAAFMAMYKDITILLAAAVVAATYHIVFTYLQLNNFEMMGTPILFFYSGACSWAIAILHIVLWVLEFLGLSYIMISNTKQYIHVKKLEQSSKDSVDKLEDEKKINETLTKNLQDSIKYASLIQGSVVSEEKELSPFFKDHFVYWNPKDTVGGDIWLFNELRHEDECLLFFIDCTGHGVPGAFVTMIVKAIEREIVSKLKKHPEIDISPALIMSYFNKTMKTLLKQETKDSKSNAGFDGGVIYYNRRTQILKFAGAETPLFYITQDGELHTIKGNRYSVGYKKCDVNYEYKESIIEVQEGMKFFCTTDGYLDQNGGEKGFPFGKKKFSHFIKEFYTRPMPEMQTIFQTKLKEWETTKNNYDRNDDITLIGFEIKEQSMTKDDVVKEIFNYEGVITQNVIASAMDNIEAKIQNMSTMGTLSTITIEYCQNMMNYAKNDQLYSREIIPEGMIEIQLINESYYEVTATNIFSKDDREKIEPKLLEIQSLDKSGIKKRYRELRKSGENKHQKGGGIGMYEIAKVSDKLEYSFKAINEDKYYFSMKSTVKIKQKSTN